MAFNGDMEATTQQRAEGHHGSTLANVAARAGVSLKTASRVLRGEPNVSADKTARTLAAARELGYRRNAAASLLAQGRGLQTVGLIIGDLTNPFYSAIAQGFEDEVRSSGLTLMLASHSESPDRERSLAANLADAGAQAIVVASSADYHDSYAPLISREVAVVFVDRPPRGVEADTVVFDDESAGRAAAEHLADGGHRHIAFIGDYEWLPTSRARLEGVRQALQERFGDETNIHAAFDVHDGEAARHVVRKLLALPTPPSAIIAGNNLVFAGVVEETQSADREIALVGFDDVEWARLLGLTVVATDGREMGQSAARLVLARIKDPSRPVQTVVLRAPLVVRQRR